MVYCGICCLRGVTWSVTKCDMKLKPFWTLEMQARLDGLRAWNLWAAQGGLRGKPSRLALRAREIAEARRALAEVYAALDRVFPLGLTWVKEGAV